MSGAGEAWNGWRFFYCINRISDAEAQAKWLHSRIPSASINNTASGFFDSLIGCLDINRKTIGKRELLQSMTIDKDFPRKVTHCTQVLFFSQSLSGALIRTTQWWARKPKAKENTAAKMEKPENAGVGEARQRIDRQLWNLRFEATILFLHQGWYFNK